LIDAAQTSRRVGAKARHRNAPVDDFDASLRRSEQKKRELRRRINELLGEE
jgi:hypothetical protein